MVFYGMSDEMEIAYIALQEFTLKLVGIVEDDGKFHPQILLGYEIEPVSRIQEPRPDCVFITALEEIEQKRVKLQTLLAGKSIVIKDLCMP